MKIPRCHIRFLYLLVINCIAFAAFGQNPDVSIFVMKGTVTAAEDETPVAYAAIANKTRATGASGDENGMFSMNVQVGDSIEVFAMGYEKQSFVVQMENEGSPLQVALKSRTYELEGVDIFAFRTEKDVKRHLMDMKLPEKDKFEHVRNVERTYDPGSGGVAISGPLSFAYNKFSRGAKSYQKYLKAKENYDNSYKVRVQLDEDLVKRITGIEDKEELEAFITYCDEGDRFGTPENEYDVIVAVQRCYKSFVEGRN